MFKRIDHIELLTAHPERAIAFYTRVRGFKVRARDRVPNTPLGPLDLAYLDLGGTTVELIVRMAIVAEGRVVRIPTLPRSEWQGFPVGSPEAWAVSYALLGRVEKSERLFRQLEAGGANADDVRRMLEEPLPEALAARLRSLPARTAEPLP